MSRYEDGHLVYFKSRGVTNYKPQNFAPRQVDTRNTEWSHDSVNPMNQMSMNAFITKGVSSRPNDAQKSLSAAIARDALTSYKYT